MLFSTPFFLFVFFPLVFGLYRLVVPGRALCLLAASLLFYAWGEPEFVLVVLVSALLDWRLGPLLAGRSGRLWLTLGVAVNLGLLVYAKYTVFALETVNRVLTTLAVDPFLIPELTLPLGISFIVFEKITYLVDIHRGVSSPSPSLLNYLTYVFLFPKLLAGPIVKYHDISAQLVQPRVTPAAWRDGLIRFLEGLGKKVMIADSLAPYVDQIFALPAAALDPGTAWLGALAFHLQIFFDFSGYSDMAIGLAQMLGFQLRENFDQPYRAASFTDFWRRWHISLSSWIREYLYFPLGGGRRSPARGYLNLSLCFLASGLWHGAAWNFVVWGLGHGLALIVDRLGWLKFSQRWPRPLTVGLTTLALVFSWVLFRSPSMTFALLYLKAMLGAPALSANDAVWRADIGFYLLLGAYLAYRPARLPEGVCEHRPGRLAWVTLLLLLCTGRLVVNAFHPFLYFRF